MLLLLLQSPQHPTPPPTHTYDTDGEDSNGNGNNNGLPGGLDLAKIFTPPSTTAPFGGLGQQVASFFERLLNPVGGNGGKVGW